MALTGKCREHLLHSSSSFLPLCLFSLFSVALSGSDEWTILEIEILEVLPVTLSCDYIKPIWCWQLPTMAIPMVASTCKQAFSFTSSQKKWSKHNWYITWKPPSSTTYQWAGCCRVPINTGLIAKKLVSVSTAFSQLEWITETSKECL